MPHAYANIAFTPAVRDVQTRMGSRENYAPFDDVPAQNNRIGQREAEFIAARDGFYQATVSETGWPYVQFRGGPTGFLKVLDGNTLGYADFRGNMQYISVGNFANNDRVSIILMDYPNRARLKILGRVRVVGLDDDPALIAKLESPTYRARVQRGVVITVEAFDWNCPQHITPRFTETEVSLAAATLHAQIADLKAQLSARQNDSSPSPKTLGDGPLTMIISEIRQLTPRVRAFVLRNANDEELPPVEPGAHIDVPVRIAARGDAGAFSATRRYSITASTANSYEIAVQENPNGAGGSAAVHQDYQLGTTLKCGLPGNDFRLHADARPAVLIAGGIGITPIRAMASALVEGGRKVHLHYAVRSRADAAFAEQLKAELGETFHLYVGDLAQRLDVSALLTNAAISSVVYVCGPSSLIEAVSAAGAQAGIAVADINFERFTVDKKTDDRPVRVTLRRSGKTIDVNAGQSILDAVQAAGVGAAASCRSGTCGTCAVKVISGQPDHRDFALTTEERTKAGLVCICVSRASSAELTLDL